MTKSPPWTLVHRALSSQFHRDAAGFVGTS
jgi:hypothetical protein